MSIFFKTSDKSARQAWIFIALAVAMAIISTAIAPSYYNWVLNNQKKVTLKIFCDTSEINSQDLTIFLLYDKVALHPLSKAFGLFQLRSPEKATSFYAIKANNCALTPYSITITNVPASPLVRIQIVSGEKRFFTLVRDRRIFNNTITVRVSSSTGSN